MFGGKKIKEHIFPLSMVPPGKEVVLQSITGSRSLRARLTDMGLNEGMKLRVLQAHRMGPCVVLANNTRLVLGHGMAQKILVKDG
jgi:Fe2+ transport system protein FeoA